MEATLSAGVEHENGGRPKRELHFSSSRSGQEDRSFAPCGPQMAMNFERVKRCARQCPPLSRYRLHPSHPPPIPLISLPPPHLSTSTAWTPQVPYQWPRTGRALVDNRPAP